MKHTARGRPSVEDLLLGLKPGPAPDCPDELEVFHAASGLLSAEEHQAFERHLHTCLYCRDRELEARKLLYFEQHGIPYTLDSRTARLRRLSGLAALRARLSRHAATWALPQWKPPGRLAVALLGMLVLLVSLAGAHPTLARSAPLLATARQVPLVRWLLPAPVREYLEASLIWDRLKRVPAVQRSAWISLARTAEQHLVRAVHLDPDYADAHFLLGQLYADLYYRLQDPAALEKARLHYLRAISLQPHHLQARYALASDVYSAQGRWQDELHQYDAILRLDPTHTDARWARGWLRLELHQPDLAIQDFREILRQEPHDFETLWAIGLAQLLSGRTADLQHTLRQLRQVNPGRARLLEQLAARMAPRTPR